MAAAVDSTASAHSASAASLTTGSISPGGSNRYAIGGFAGTGGTASSFKYGGSGGTDLTQNGSNQSVYFGLGDASAWDLLPGSGGGSVTFYSAFSGTIPGAIAAITLTGVDQSTPTGTITFGPDNEYSGDQNPAASITVTGLSAGQLVIAILAVCDAGDKAISSITAGANTTVEVSAIETGGGGGQPSSIAILSGVSAGTSLTLNATINTASTGGYLGWKWIVYPIIDASGGASHTSTGALSAQAATVAGTAAHLTLHATSGALAAQAAAIAGTADHLTLHDTSGALAAQAATVAGTAAHVGAHDAAGALTAQAATVAGAADHRTLHDTSGALAAQAATVAGAAAHEHASSGALAAQAATVAGTADHLAAGDHTSTGALAAQAATVSGTAAVVATGQNVLSAKYLGGHKNVKFKPLKRQPASQEILQPEVTNVTHVKPPVRTHTLLDMLDGLPTPAPAPATPTPAPAPTPAPKPAPKPAEPPKEAPAPEPAPPAPPAAVPEPVDLSPVLAANAALTKQVEALSAALAQTQATLDQLLALQAKSVEVAEKVAKTTDDQARRARNAARAAAIAEKLLKH